MKIQLVILLSFITVSTAGCTDVPMLDWFAVAVAFATGWKLTDAAFSFIARKIDEHAE